jgi:sarcosine oxidase gamma subunit
VTLVLASSDACDRLRGFPGAFRIAPDEVMIVEAASKGETAAVGDASFAALTRAVHRVDEDAVVLDVSPGWERLTLEGPEAHSAFARVSELGLPTEGFAQGEVARVGVRIVVRRDRIDLLVPAMLAEHVRGRIASECAELLG